MTPKDLTRRRGSNESVCKMAPQRGRLRESAACLVSSCPIVCLSVNQLFSNLRCVWSISGHHQVDLEKSCTASKADGCFHLEELSQWNNFLWVVSIKLREEQLGLACLCGSVVSLAFNTRLRRSFILVHWPLMQHLSTEFLELLESRMSPKQSQLRDGLELSEHLRHARLCCHLLDDPTTEQVDTLHSIVTTLDPLDIVSVRFSSVGVSMSCELLDKCDVMLTHVFFEKWTDVPDTQALMC
ncbi:uncharacterized protein [Dermacentor albipictus]|uniref:uncharacterized protein n=1 Tax=Dermacentor albipictus TaxID=60249 RepID=UPI0038FCBB2C